MPPWSYTALTAFENCPQRYFQTRVVKAFHDEQNEASLWGNRVHTALEDCVKTGKPLGEGMEQWQSLADKFRSRFEAGANVLVEKKLAINKFYVPVAWTAGDAWCRGIVDIAVWKEERIVAADWKTGKRKFDSDQMKLFAGLLFCHYPDVKTVKSSFVWLKEGATDSEEFEEEKKEEIWNTFIPRVRKMEEAYESGKWPARPSGLCRGWCPVKICPHWGPKKDT
jgi:hypothetical protein